MRIALLSDTHAPRFWKRCPAAVATQLEQAELILHAGDVCVPAVLDELSGWAPVLAVRGNNDGPDIPEWGAPDVLHTTVAGVQLAMVHDSGPATGRLRRMRARFPDADVVIFGHSHIPWHEHDPATGLHIINPGSPTDRRRQPFATMAMLELIDGRFAELTVVPVS